MIPKSSMDRLQRKMKQMISSFELSAPKIVQLKDREILKVLELENTTYVLNKFHGGGKTTSLIYYNNNIVVLK